MSLWIPETPCIGVLTSIFGFNKSKAQIYEIHIIGLNSEAFLGTLEEPQKKKLNKYISKHVNDDCKIETDLYFVGHNKKCVCYSAKKSPCTVVVFF